jgi:hypothetical protein
VLYSPRVMDTQMDTCSCLPELDFGQMPPSVCLVKCECCCAEARLCGPVTFRFWRAVFFGNWCRAWVGPTGRVGNSIQVL